MALLTSWRNILHLLHSYLFQTCRSVSTENNRSDNSFWCSPDHLNSGILKGGARGPGLNILPPCPSALIDWLREGICLALPSTLMDWLRVGIGLASESVLIDWLRVGTDLTSRFCSMAGSLATDSSLFATSFSSLLCSSLALASPSTCLTALSIISSKNFLTWVFVSSPISPLHHPIPRPSLLNVRIIFRHFLLWEFGDLDRTSWYRVCWPPGLTPPRWCWLDSLLCVSGRRRRLSVDRTACTSWTCDLEVLVCNLK